MNRQFLASFFVLVLIFFTSCTGIPAETTPSPIHDTPIPTSISTQLPTEHPLPTCTPIPSDYVYVIDHAVYDNVNPGLEFGVWEAINLLEQSLKLHHSEWYQYIWIDSEGKEHQLSEYVWDSSHAQFIGINPRVLLVIAGFTLEWQIPTDQNIGDAISEIGVTLNEYYWDFEFNEDLQERYQRVENAPTYALYAFFDYDLKRLNNWASEYDRLFGTLQTRIISEDCQLNIP